MKAVILAGGFGTRISEETTLRPKPLIEIGSRPILWHIMKIYSAYGINEFVICLGYKGYMIKEFFANYYTHTCDVTFDMRSNTMHVHRSMAEPWTVTLVDTGEQTMTGGRLKRASEYIGEDELCFTYGDGLSDVNIADVIAFHRRSGTLATVTATRPAGRFGALTIRGQRVVDVQEKPLGDGGWINGGFFVLSRRAIDQVEGDGTVWEEGPLQRLARAGELSVFHHSGFWHAMDTLRDKLYLEKLWSDGAAPWRVWS
jgi:glucose-1-phosphate cytidylyltransferase